MSDTPAAEDPRITRSRALILEAATVCFVEHGFERTSVDEVAARAGIAKRTVYNIYGDKESLFRASLAVTVATAERFTRERLEDVGSLERLDETLPDLASRLARDVLLGRVVPFRRLIAAEAARFPEIAADYRDRAPEAILRGLAAGFRALGARGLLQIDDPGLAAEHFAFLVLGAELDRRMFGDDATPPAGVEARAVAGARAFLRAYRPDAPRSVT